MRSNDPRHSRWHRLLHLIALTLSLSMILSSFGLAPAAFAQLAPNGSTGSPSPSPTGSRHRFESDAERFNRRHRS